MHREALAMRRKLLGNEHPDVALSLDNLADVLQAQGKLAEAETMYREALAMRRKLLGNEHPDVAISLINLADVLRKQGEHDEAKELLRSEIAAIRMSTITNPAFERMLQEYADIHYRQSQYAEAEPLYRELIDRRTTRRGAEHEEA